VIFAGARHRGHRCLPHQLLHKPIPVEPWRYHSQWPNSSRLEAGRACWQGQQQISRCVLHAASSSDGGWRCYCCQGWHGLMQTLFVTVDSATGRAGYLWMSCKVCWAAPQQLTCRWICLQAGAVACWVMCQHRECFQPYNNKPVERGRQSTDAVSTNCSRVPRPVALCLENAKCCVMCGQQQQVWVAVLLLKGPA
jgi:hypothetical protein